MEWKKQKLREIGQIISGATPRTSDPSNYGGDIAWITPADLSGFAGKYISTGARNITKKGYESCSTQLMPKGTVLFSSRAPIGYVAIASNDVCTNQGFKSVVPRDTVDSEFLYYQLVYLRDRIRDMGSGTTFKEISGKKLGEVDVVMPCLDEQRRIVSRIEEMFSELDNCIATLQRTKEQLAIYRQAVLKEAFDKGSNNQFQSIEKLLTKKRKGMATGPFGTMIKKSDYRQSGVPVLGIENIGRGTFKDGNKIFVTQQKSEELKSFKLLSGDIIISRSGTVGEICIVPKRAEGALLSTNLIRVSLDDNIIVPEYFVELFQSKGVVLDQVKELCKGSTRDFLNQTILKKLVFPVPKIEDQRKILSELEDKKSVCDYIENTVNAALQQAEAMRKSILKQAFEGRL